MYYPALNVALALISALTVFMTKKIAPSPIVSNPDGCIDHCHGCGNKCPVGAITYVGDDTGWIPPVLRDKGDMHDVTLSCG